VIKPILLLILGFLALVIIDNSAYGITPLERTVINDERLVNLSGSAIGDQIIVNQQVQVTAKIINTQEKAQNFVYIVQIKDQYDIVVKLGWISGSMTKHQSLSPSLSWTPKQSGAYTAEIFVWDSLANQDALTESVKLEIIAS
jgi:hypothetical protein